MVGFVIIGARVATPSRRLGLGVMYFSFVSVFYHRVSGSLVELLSRGIWSWIFFFFWVDLFGFDVGFSLTFEK
jgi:hypothetical protein